MNENIIEAKLKIDTSDTKRVEREIKQMGKSASTTSEASKATSQSMSELRGSLEAIRSLSVFGLITNQLDNITNKWKEVKGAWIQFDNDFKDLGDDILVVIDASRDLAKMKGISPFKQWRKELKDRPELMEGVKSSWKNLGASVKSLLGTVFNPALLAILGIVLAIKTVVGTIRMVNQISAVGAEIDDMAQKVQMSNEQYQQWDYIMKMCGGTMEDLKTAMNGMTQRLKSVDEGSASAIEGFQKLGISVYDASGQLRDSDKLFEEAVYKLQMMEQGTERQVIANQIFGKSASNLNILLNTSNEQMQNIIKTQEVLALSMSENAIKMSATYQDAIDTMKQAGQSLKSTLAEVFLKPFTNIVKSIIKAITYIKVFIQALFGLKSSPTAKVEDSVGNVGTNADNSQKKVEKLKRSLMGFDELNVVPSGQSEDTGIDTEIGDLGLNDTKAEFDALFSDEELGKIEKFKEKITGFVEAVKKNPIVQGIVNIVKTIFGGIREILDSTKESVGGTLTELWNLIVSIWKVIYPVIQLAVDLAVGLIVPAIKIVLQAIKSVVGIISAVVDTIIGIVSGIWTMIEGFFTFIYGWLTGDMEMMIDGVETYLEGFLQFWGSLWDGVKRILSNVWDFIKSVIVGITDGISNVVNAIRDFFGIDGNKKVGYTFTGGYTPNVAMATGGITTGPTRALIGEAGREAVLPLENNTGWMDALADRIASRNSSPSKIVLKVGEKELGWATINGINSITKQTGEVQLIV